MTSTKQWGGRNWHQDLERVCQEIVHSLEHMTDAYDSYGQDDKRPFGNSGGPWYDLVEIMDMYNSNPCTHKGCENCREEMIDYAKALWAAAEKALPECLVSLPENYTNC